MSATGVSIDGYEPPHLSCVMCGWGPTPECNDRCYGEPCVHRG